jgi:hypothetical protein
LAQPPDQYAAASDYGRGIFRRRIRLMQQDGLVTGMLDDTHHAIWVRIGHDGTVVTTVAGGFSRMPNTACPGAGIALRELRGMPLTTPLSELYGGGRPLRNCTHMFDVAALAVSHARRETGTRVFDVTIPDALTGPQKVEVRIDGRIIHDWLVDDGRIVEPAAYAGRAIIGGFSAWAYATFEGDFLEAALVLQKGWFLSRARRYVVDSAPPVALATFRATRSGVCYAYTDPQLSTAWTVPGYVRDFSAGVVEAMPPSATEAGE